MEKFESWVHGVVFDVGGVLALDVQEHLFSDEARGVPAVFGVSHERSWPIVSQLWRKYACEKRTDHTEWRDLEQQYWSEFNQELGTSIPVDSLIELSTAFFTPVEGMLGLLAQLKGMDFHILVCSNNTEFWYQRQSQALGLEQFVMPEDVILSCRVGASKSNPEFPVLQAVKQRLQFDERDYLFVDNHFTNVCRANEFGLCGLYIPTASPLSALYLRNLFRRFGLKL